MNDPDLRLRLPRPTDVRTDGSREPTTQIEATIDALLLLQTRPGERVDVVADPIQEQDIAPTEHTSTVRALQPAFAASVISEPDRNVLVLRGEVDAAAVDRFRSVQQALASDPRPTVIDCSSVTFIDSAGLTELLEVLDRRPQDRLANTPARAARLLRLIGRHDVLRDRARHTVAIATFADVDVVAAARIGEVFRLANREGCAYDVVPLPVDTTTCVAPPVERRWHQVVIPPVDSWLGLSGTAPVVRWVGDLVARSDRVLGIGTGLFALAAAGCLDHHRVAGWANGTALEAAAPLATVVGAAAVVDGRLQTAADADAAVDLCADAVGHDYGDGVRHLVELRMGRQGAAPQRPRARWAS